MSQSNGPPPEPLLPPVPPPPPRGPAVPPRPALLPLPAVFVFAQTAGKRTARGEDARTAANLVLLEVNLRLGVGGLQALADQQAAADPAANPEQREQTAKQLEKARETLLKHVENSNRGPL